MAKITTAKAALVTDPTSGAPMLVLASPEQPPGAPKVEQYTYAGHDLRIYVTAVWQRMILSGISKAEALEDCVLGILDPENLGDPRAVTGSRRAAARARHDASAARRHAGLIPDPTDDDVTMLRRALRIDDDGAEPDSAEREDDDKRGKADR